MNRTLFTLAAAVSLAAPTAALACDGMQHQAQAQASYEPQKATVAEVAAWTKAKVAVPVDANGQETRTSAGVIPGAVLLTSSSEYALSELPQDKASKLVFYCATERCGASHAAAARAIEAGYTNVAVLPAGIFGWKRAGQPTAKPNS
jgi:rhodanese-related sulfurtransferase